MDQENDSRLNDAVSNKNLDEVLKLINEGVNLEYKFNTGEFTPLIIACKNNATNIALALIEKGAYVNAREMRGNTGLMYASAWGNISVATSLIRKGAEINAVNHIRQRPSRNKNDNPKYDVITLLHNGADVIEVVHVRNTALHLACQNRKAELALILIQNGANVTFRNKIGRSPLSFACENDLSDVIVSLIHNGAEVNETFGLNNETALHYAAVKNHKDTISMLLHNGADINALNKNGKTPLQLALENQSTEAVEVIRRYAERSAITAKLNPGQTLASNKLDDVVKTNKNIEKGLEKVSTKLVQIDETLHTILTRLEHLESKAKSNDQENFENVLEIAGIESKENEDLDLILLRLATILGLSLHDIANIISVHRPIKTSPAADSTCAATNCSNVIEVKFRTFETTQNWLKAFKEKRSSGITSSAFDPSLKSEKIFVNQKLTLYNKELLHRAKEFAKDEGYNFIWFQDGKILLRKDENSCVIRIERYADLPEL